MIREAFDAGPTGAVPQQRPPAIAPERFPFYDKLFLAVFVLCLPPFLASKPGLFADGDVSWHVAAGRWILEHGRIPATDPFSHTMAGQPWVAHEWLAEVIYGAAFDLARYAGLAAVVTAALMALHFVVFRHLRSRVGPVAMLAAFVALDLVLAKFLLARPHVLVWPLVALWTSLLLDARDAGRPPPLAAALLMTVWTNLHGSFALGLVIAGAIALDAVMAARWERRALVGWATFGSAALLATLLNLNGIPGLIHPFTIMGMDTLHLISEWKSSSPTSSPFFYVVLIGTLAACLLSGVRLKLGEALLLLLLLALVFLQIRHQSWLAIIAVLILTPRLAGHARAQAPQWFASARERHLWIFGALVVAVVLIGARLLLPLQPRENSGTPTSLIAHIPDALRSQPVLNEYSFGGPLILAGIRPYIDGRADMYGDEFLQDYVHMVNDGEVDRFERAVRRYGIRWTILPPDSGLIEKLDASAEWRRIYSDKIGVIHVRRGM